MGSSRLQRRLLPGGRVLVALALMSVLGANAVGISMLLGSARDHYQVAAMASVLQVNVTALGDANGDLTRPSANTASKLDRSQALQGDLGDELGAISHSGLDRGDIVPLRAAVLAFVSRSAQLRRAAAKGDLSEATALDRQNDAGFNGLGMEIQRADQELSAAAASSIVFAERGVVTLGALLLGSVAGAVAWDGRRRRLSSLRRADAESRARYEAMVEGGSDLLVLTDRLGNCLYDSPAVRRVLGYG
ncbi:MAG TPA: hypothetical protein VMS00_01490, partial [Acidimicrobiales bacterium]|nr:hypothetical protein [Acidimicrobiales bacterium]